MFILDIKVYEHENQTNFLSFLFSICNPHNPPLDPPMSCVIAIDLFNQLQRELY